MANERQRAEKLESQFQQLLEELKAQDEQLESLFVQAGVSRDELPEVDVERADMLLEDFEEAVVERRRQLLSQRDRKAMSGLVLRA